jgi:mono/diheme cytochrome c family protein
VIAIALAALVAQTPSPTSEAQEIFQQRCKLCHGEDGRGKTRKGKEYKVPNFTSKKFQKRETDDEIKDAIANGIPKTKMKGFKDKLTPEQIDALVKYVRAFGSKN